MWRAIYLLAGLGLVGDGFRSNIARYASSGDIVTAFTLTGRLSLSAPICSGKILLIKPMNAAGFCSACRARYSTPPAPLRAATIMSLTLVLSLFFAPLGLPLPAAGGRVPLRAGIPFRPLTNTNLCTGRPSDCKNVNGGGKAGHRGASWPS